ncbi:MAG: glycerol-3-phosphate dehydrogenase/oxidase [Planctomycetota bacterium]|jgi:glycerol-3-phosphate dehydrogenase
MNRDLNKLSNTEYDVAIVGAGIYGISAAWDAALRGLKVALIDKGDFVNATSSNSLKLIHGGLRYLQHLDFKRMRESIHERMVLMRIAPHLVHPQPVVMPTFGHAFKSRPALWMASLVNNLVGFDRNRLKDPHKYLPQGHLVSPEQLKEYVPGYKDPSFSGGVVWYDCQCYNTERLGLSYVLSATEAGADVANYVECMAFLGDPEKVTGIRAKDCFTGELFDIRAKMVINASGPWVDEVLRKVPQESPDRKFLRSTAMNIVVKRKLLDTHVAGLPGPHVYKKKDGTVSRGSRILFFVPWRDITIIGTDHQLYEGGSDDFYPDKKQVENFLESANWAYPNANIKREEISLVHRGFLPMVGVNVKTGAVKLGKSYQIHDDKIDGLLTVVGVKYTTHRDVTSKIVDLVFGKLGRPAPECRTSNTPVYGGDIDRFEDFLNESLRTSTMDKSITRHLVYNYGSKYKDILNYAKADPALGEPVPGSTEVLKAEILNGVRKEMALKLSDVVLRRTDLGSDGNPGDAALETAAGIMGKELGWEDTRIKSEIEETKSVYQLAS